MPYRIKNWDHYQARNKRESNPWVKLHKSILLSRDFFGVCEKRRWEVTALLLLAKHDTGIIESSDEDICFKLRLTSFDATAFIPWFLESVVASGDQWLPVAADGALEEEERRRREEEEKIVLGAASSIQAGPADDEWLCHPDNGKPIDFPINVRNKFTQVKRSKAIEWDQLHGKQINVLQEILKARQWLRDTPAKRKTARGMTRFLSGWLGRAADSGKGTPPLTDLQKREQRWRLKKAQEADRDQQQRHNRRNNGTDTEPTPISESLGIDTEAPSRPVTGRTPHD